MERHCNLQLNQGNYIRTKLQVSNTIQYHGRVLPSNDIIDSKYIPKLWTSSMRTHASIEATLEKIVYT